MTKEIGSPRWSRAEIKELERLVASDTPVREIERNIGRSKEAIISKTQREGFIRPSKRPQLRESHDAQ